MTPPARQSGDREQSLRHPPWMPCGRTILPLILAADFGGIGGNARWRSSGRPGRRAVAPFGPVRGKPALRSWVDRRRSVCSRSRSSSSSTRAPIRLRLLGLWLFRFGRFLLFFLGGSGFFGALFGFLPLSAMSGLTTGLGSIFGSGLVLVRLPALVRAWALGFGSGFWFDNRLRGRGRRSAPHFNGPAEGAWLFHRTNRRRFSARRTAAQRAATPTGPVRVAGCRLGATTKRSTWR